jgi:hypothetical protein
MKIRTPRFFRFTILATIALSTSALILRTPVVLAKDSLSQMTALGTVVADEPMASKTSTVSEVLTATSGATRNNNGVGCDGTVCSSDGKWRADRVELFITAPAGMTLSTPTVSCVSDNVPGACQFRDIDILQIEQGGQRAHLSLRAYSWPTIWTLSAIASVAT